MVILQFDLCCALDDVESGYVIGLLAMEPSSAGCCCCLAIDLLPETLLRPGRSLPPGYLDQKKDSVQFWSDIVCFDSRTQSKLEYFVRWHHREDEVVSADVLEGRCVHLSL